MPLYNYICTECKKKQERIYRGEELKCEHCGGALVKELSASGILVRYAGSGWACKS